jgi:hypothetical protein
MTKLIGHEKFPRYQDAPIQEAKVSTEKRLVISYVVINKSLSSDKMHYLLSVTYHAVSQNLATTCQI